MMNVTVRNTIQPKRERGFTLIELLVVVAIIALLIAILMPSLSRARQQAKNTVCMSSLKQIGTALTTYAAQNPRKFVFPDWETVGGASFRVFPGYRDPLANQVETLGLPAVLAKTRNLKLDSKLWMCPLNDRDAKYGNTYFWNNNDAQTQNPNNYKPGRRVQDKKGKNPDQLDQSGMYYVGDNYNLRPYSPGAKPRTDQGSQKQGSNTGYFIESRFYHVGRASRPQSNDTSGVVRSYGKGFNAVRFDSTVAFFVIEQQ